MSKAMVWWGNVIYEGTHGLYITKEEALKDAWMGEENVFKLVDADAYDKAIAALRAIAKRSKTEETAIIIAGETLKDLGELEGA